MNRNRERSGAVDQATDIPNSRPRLRDGLRFVARTNSQGASWFRLEDDPSGRFHRIGIAEYEFLIALNGQRTIEDCRHMGALATNHQRVLTAEQAESLIYWAADQSLLEGYRPSPSKPEKDHSSSLTWIKLPLFTRDTNWQPLVQIVGPLFSKQMMAASVCLWLLACTIVVADHERFIRDFSAIFVPGAWVTVALVWLGLKLIHELGHLACCQRYGGQVGEVGIAWMLITPVAYVDLTDAYRIRSRSKRVMLCLSGVYAECIVAAIAILFWWNATAPATCHLLLTIAATASVASLLFNLNPLMRLDGYHAVCDWLDRPNLAGEATKAMRRLCASLFLGKHNTHHPIHVGMAAYGSAMLIYRVMISTGLVMAAYTWYGAAVMTIVAGVIALAAMPTVLSVLRTLVRECKSRPATLVRVSAMTMVFALLGMATLQLRQSLQSKWIGIVEYEDDTPVRCLCSGKVVRVLFEPGQRVVQGQPLVALENVDILADCSTAQCEWEIGETKWKRFRELHLVREAASERQSNDAIATRLAHLKRQEQSLLIRAPRDGQVVAIDSENWLGRWFKEGEALLHVVDAAKKKVIVAIPQSSLEQVNDLAGKRITLGKRDGIEQYGKVTSINYQATLTPAHPALSAKAGGPLMVRSDRHGDDAKLITPHLRVEAILPDSSLRWHPGQQVTITLANVR